MMALPGLDAAVRAVGAPQRNAHIAHSKRFGRYFSIYKNTIFCRIAVPLRSFCTIMIV